MPFVRCSSRKTFYKTYGRGTGVPLVCLHGGPGGTHKYFDVLERANLGREIIVYDQIGSGQSSPLKAKDQKIETFVDDLSNLVKKLKLIEFHLLGTSWGATLALEYYFRKQGRGVQSLILQSPLISTKIWEKDANSLLRKLPKRTQKVIRVCTEIGATDSQVYRDAEREFYKRHCFRGKPLKSNIEYFKKYPNAHGNALYQNMWGTSEFKCLGTLKSYNRISDLRKITVPTLYLSGVHDEVGRSSLKKFKDATASGRMKIIPKASHTILRENPKPMIKVLDQFLQQVDQ